MKKRSIWLLVSCLVVATLLVASCAPIVIEEEETTPPLVQEVVPSEEEGAAPPEEDMGMIEEESRSCEGYTLYRLSKPGNHAILINMNGEEVHEWPIAGSPVKMLPGGSMLGSKSVRNAMALSTSQQLNFGGRNILNAIEFVQIGWDDQEEWSFSNWEDDGTGKMMSGQHHDYQREGNPVGYYAPGQQFVKSGKTLILSRKNKVVPEISTLELEVDVIYEVDWNGNLTGFEWDASDHFNEMGFDESAREAIYNGLTYNEAQGYIDWLHVNSMSLLGQNHWYDETHDERFNPENIIISSRNANFIAIISRVTGNITWRVGPDFSKGTPEYNLGQFVGQHHAHMIPSGLPGEGNILVFDNGGRSGYGGPTLYPRYRRQYSRVIEFNPVTLEIVWQYGAESGKEMFFSRDISSAQRLPNGNTLITDGANGRIFEVTPDKDIVWKFVSPITGENGNDIYRAYRIPPEWVPGNPAGYTEWATLYE
jgi:arylsulfotransferase ASST